MPLIYPDVPHVSFRALIIFRIHGGGRDGAKILLGSTHYFLSHTVEANSMCLSPWWLCWLFSRLTWFFKVEIFVNFSSSQEPLTIFPNFQLTESWYVTHNVFFSKRNNPLLRTLEVLYHFPPTFLNLVYSTLNYKSQNDTVDK